MVRTALLTSGLRGSMRSVAFGRCGGAGGKLSLWVVEIRSGIGIVGVKRRDAGRRVQRKLWESDVVGGLWR